MTAQKKDEDVGVYIKTRGEEAVQGVVVTVIDGNKEAVLVNIVGDIKPEKLAIIGERFNIEPLKKIGGGARQISSATLPGGGNRCERRER